MPVLKEESVMKIALSMIRTCWSGLRSLIDSYTNYAIIEPASPQTPDWYFKDELRKVCMHGWRLYSLF